VSHQCLAPFLFKEVFFFFFFKFLCPGCLLGTTFWGHLFPIFPQSQHLRKPVQAWGTRWEDEEVMVHVGPRTCQPWRMKTCYCDKIFISEKERLSVLTAASCKSIL
jgi:hypothetical protein